MLTYGSAAPPARTLLRGAHAAARCTNRRSVDCLVSLSLGLPSFYSSSAVSKLMPASASSVCAAGMRTTPTRPRIPQARPTHRENGSIPAGVRTFKARLLAASPWRSLSSTTNCLAKGKQGRESTTPAPPSRPDTPQQKQQQQQEQQQQQQQQHAKGVIRKVLPSLTPHENIYTVPNLLTFSRLAAAPFIGYAILHDAHALALGLFAYAGVSDLLDGWIARRWGLQTVVGSVVDPMADKALMTILTVCLAAKGALPVWLAAVILGRDAGLGAAAIYYRWISLPPPKTFTRYWDFSLPSAEVRPTTISKYNTFLQLGLMGATMVAPVLTADVSGAMTVFQ